MNKKPLAFWIALILVPIPVIYFGAMFAPGMLIALGFLAFLFILAYYVSYETLRVNDLKTYAFENNYDLFVKPSEEQILPFKNFKVMSIINIDNKFVNFLLPKSEEHNKRPKIVATSSTLHTGESSSKQYTQTFLFSMPHEIPKFSIEKKDLFSLYGYRVTKAYKFKTKKFPNKYILVSSEPNIEESITNEFIDLLNEGIKRNKRQIGIESDGNNLLFYIKYRRLSTKEINSCIYLFNALKDALFKKE